ncbi:MAG: glycosyltransferase [Candidatus Omnitrophica bacterium]|nr:glycosyltransferase [Candidatus Omnitrophota bacterium]
MIDKLETAGTQAELLELVQNLDPLKYRPFVIALTGGGPLAGHFRIAGIEPTVLHVRKVYGWRAVKAVFYLVNFMKREGIHLVQTHFLHADCLGLLAGRLAGVKKIIFSRRDEGFWRGRAELALDRILSRHADVILANSEAVKRAVIRNENAASSKIRVIHNGVWTRDYFPSGELRRAIRQSLGAGESDTVVGAVANMRHTIKGYAYLIEAVPAVVQKNPRTKFWFVGDGPLRPEFEARVKSLGMSDSVLFLGSRHDVNVLLNGMDIFCLPSLTEGFSNALLEAMAVAKPVVATDVGGNPEVAKDGQTGFLVPAADSRVLAEKILWLAGSEALRLKMGAAGRELILREFTVEQMIKKYEAFYQGMVEERR